MDNIQLEGFLRKHTPLEEKILESDNNISICSNNFNKRNLENESKKSFLSFSPNDPILDAIKQENYDRKLNISSNDNISFNIHPRFVYVEEHSHPYIEMIYVYSGCLHQIINGKRIKMEEGEICFLDTNARHSIEASSENDIIVNCLMRKSFFDSALLGHLAENDILSNFFINAVYQNKTYNEYIIFPSYKNKKVKHIMEDILCEYYDKAICTNEVINCYIIVLFAELLRIYKKDINKKNYSDLKNTKISDILLYLDNNYKTATLASTARHFYFNPSYLSNIIKKLTGQKFVDILQDIKLKNACVLLKNSKTPVNEIANNVGYVNVNFFYQIFKKRFGITPAEYRKNFNR